MRLKHLFILADVANLETGKKVYRGYKRIIIKSLITCDTALDTSSVVWAVSSMVLKVESWVTMSLHLCLSSSLNTLVRSSEVAPPDAPGAGASRTRIKTSNLE